MESNLTKRRPSLIPGCSPNLSLGWSPSFDAVEEDSNDDEENEHVNQKFSSDLPFLPAISNYDMKPHLKIKKFQYQNASTGQTVSTSMAHTHGICVLNTEEEQVIACDYYNNRLLMFDSNTDGRLLEIFRGDLTTPECVAPRPNHPKQIYISKAHSISLYDLEKKTFIHKLGNDTSGHANNRFNSPGGLAIDSDNG